NGISGVAAHDFQNGRFNSVMRVNGNQIRDAGLVRGQMPFTPNNANMRFSDRQVANVPRTSQNARFFTHQQPTPVQRNQPVGGSPNARQQPAPAAPRQEYRSNPRSDGNGQQYNQRYNQPSGGYSRQESLRMAPPVVRERPSAPSYSAPRQSAPSYSAPRQSAPSYSAPRSNAGGGNSAPRGYSGGGGGQSGGGGHQSSGGGGHQSSGGGQAGGGHRGR